MTSLLIFISGAVLLVYSAEKLVGYLVGIAGGLGVSLFLLSIVFTGIEFDDIFLGVVLNVEDLDEVALGIVFGTALSLPGVVLALAAILTPTKVNVPRDYLALFAAAPLVMFVLVLKAPLTVVDGIVLVGLFVLFICYVAIRESRGNAPVFRDAELYEAYALARTGGGTEVPGKAAMQVSGAADGGAPSGGGAVTGGGELPDEGTECRRFTDHMPFAEARRHSGWRGLVLAILALAGLIVGASTMGIGIEGILDTYGFEGTLFGATIVTVVLTIEDIFLTVEPARKGAPEIGVGNVIGSVIFSVTGKLGIILLAGGLVIGSDVLSWHLPALIVLTWLAAYFLSTGRLRRWHGYLLLSLYVVYWAVSFGVLGTAPVEMD
ncbi:sodium:proton exchanger [Saccharomonospora sp. NPDC046836]|uniref:sodium:calcium antiporter n=1 Tax=Saccharomonospora sp. NPDC046836 TaxID=3156921 RepID=UPI0033D018E7